MQAEDQIRASDVTAWGVVALVCGALAVLSANISAILPQGALAGLHTSRIDGANMSQLRVQLNSLQAETVRLRRDASAMQTRFVISEESDTAVTRRVGALESSIPKLLEALPPGAEIDRTNITASIPEGAVTTYDADGGSVAVTHMPLSMGGAPALATQPMPAPVPNPMAFGLAIGPEVTPGAAPVVWQATLNTAGPLLNGLGPLLADQSQGEAKRIVAGPIADAAEAQRLCNALIEHDLECMPVPFTGSPL